MASGSIRIDGVTVIDREPWKRGGVAEIYRGLSPTHGRVIVKVLRQEFVHHGLLIQHFRAEYNNGRKFGFTNRVPKAYAYGKLPDGRPYMVIERIDGMDALSLLRHARRVATPLSLRFACRIVEETAEILHGLLDLASLIHRDISPDNIMVSDDGSKVFLIDFGIAEQGNALAIGAGKPAYTAVTDGKKSEASDIFSLGVTLFELLTGQSPYPRRPATRADEAEAKAAVEAGRLRRLRDLRPDAPEWLEQLVASMLHASPIRRPKAEQVAQNLRRAHLLPIARDDIDAVPEGDGEELPKIPWRMVTVGAAAALLLISGMVGGIWILMRDGQAPVANQARPPPVAEPSAPDSPVESDWRRVYAPVEPVEVSDSAAPLAFDWMFEDDRPYVPPALVLRHARDTACAFPDGTVLNHESESSAGRRIARRTRVPLRWGETLHIVYPAGNSRPETIRVYVPDLESVRTGAATDVRVELTQPAARPQDVARQSLTAAQAALNALYSAAKTRDLTDDERRAWSQTTAARLPDWMYALGVTMVAAAVPSLNDRPIRPRIAITIEPTEASEPATVQIGADEDPKGSGQYELPDVRWGDAVEYRVQRGGLSRRHDLTLKLPDSFADEAELNALESRQTAEQQLALWNEFLHEAAAVSAGRAIAARWPAEPSQWEVARHDPARPGSPALRLTVAEGERIQFDGIEVANSGIIDLTNRRWGDTVRLEVFNQDGKRIGPVEIALGLESGEDLPGFLELDPLTLEQRLIRLNAWLDYVKAARMTDAIQKNFVAWMAMERKRSLAAIRKNHTFDDAMKGIDTIRKEAPALAGRFREEIDALEELIRDAGIQHRQTRVFLENVDQLRRRLPETVETTNDVRIVENMIVEIEKIRASDTPGVLDPDKDDALLQLEGECRRRMQGLVNLIGNHVAEVNDPAELERRLDRMMKKSPNAFGLVDVEPVRQEVAWHGFIRGFQESSTLHAITSPAAMRAFQGDLLELWDLLESIERKSDAMHFALETIANAALNDPDILRMAPRMAARTRIQFIEMLLFAARLNTGISELSRDDGLRSATTQFFAEAYYTRVFHKQLWENETVVAQIKDELPWLWLEIEKRKDTYDE